MKNYYEILEVDKNASPEIIEKAYKTLVKHYHPDLQKEYNKQNSENMIKLINEAYDVLSNPEQRQAYNNTLENNNDYIKKYNLLIAENKMLKNELNYLKNNSNYKNHNYCSNKKYHKQNLYNPYNNMNNTNNNYSNSINNNYNNNFFKDKIRYIFENLLSLIISLIIIFIVFQIPFFKSLFLEFNIFNNGFVLVIVILILYFINKK